MKTTTVTLEYDNEISKGDFWLKPRGAICWARLYSPEAEKMFGARIVNKVRKANGKPVKVKLTAEVMK